MLFSDCRSADEVRECVAIARPETPEDGGTYGVATRRFTYMGYGGSMDYVRALRDVVVVIMIEKDGAVQNLGGGAVGAGRRHDPVGRFGLLHERRASGPARLGGKSRPSSAR